MAARRRLRPRRCREIRSSQQQAPPRVSEMTSSPARRPGPGSMAGRPSSPVASRCRSWRRRCLPARLRLPSTGEVDLDPRVPPFHARVRRCHHERIQEPRRRGPRPAVARVVRAGVRAVTSASGPPSLLPRVGQAETHAATIKKPLLARVLVSMGAVWRRVIMCPQSHTVNHGHMMNDSPATYMTTPCGRLAPSSAGPAKKLRGVHMQDPARRDGRAFSSRAARGGGLLMESGNDDATIATCCCSMARSRSRST